jgi:hypothetical protein
VLAAATCERCSAGRIGPEGRAARATSDAGGGGAAAPSKPCAHIVAFHDAYTDPHKGSVCMVSLYSVLG